MEYTQRKGEFYNQDKGSTEAARIEFGSDLEAVK
jgi:hypothetical protein